MYGSYYMVFVSCDDLKVASDERMLFFKVKGPDLATIEQYMLDSHIPGLNERTGHDYALRTIEKHYAYSHEEYTMMGDYDLEWVEGVEFKMVAQNESTQIKVVKEGDLELVICSECGSDNVLTAKADCKTCEHLRNGLLEVAPDLASCVALT